MLDKRTIEPGLHGFIDGLGEIDAADFRSGISESGAIV